MTEVNRSAEKLLLEGGKWPLRLLQAVGYFPYEVSNDHLVISQPSKKLALWSAIIVALRIHHDYEFLANYDLVVDYLQLQRSTDRLMVKLMILMLSVATYWFRIFPLISRRTFEDFWKKTVKVVELTSEHADFRLDRKHSGNFSKITKAMRNIAVAIIIVTSYEIFWLSLSTHIDASPGYERDGIADRLNWHLKLALYTWCFTTFFHGFAQLQLLYFVQIYTTILTMIGDEFHELNETLGNMKTVLHDEDSIVEPPKDKNTNVEHARRKFRHGVESFKWTQEMVMHYSSVYGKGILIEMGTSTVLTLVYAYLGVYWYSVGMYMAAIGTLMIIWLFGYKIYAIATASSKMEAAAKRVAKEIILVCNDTWVQDSSLLCQVRGINFSVRKSPRYTWDFSVVFGRILVALFFLTSITRQK